MKRVDLCLLDEDFELYMGVDYLIMMIHRNPYKLYY